MIFRYTILYVESVPNALSFYQEAFGLDILHIHEGEDYGELSTGETKLAFAARSLIAQLGQAPATADPSAPTFELGFEVRDVRSALDRALTAGAKLVQDLRQESWGQTTSYVSCPDGYLIEICSPVQVPNPG